ncbi:MAG TPA: DUF58 domain-containing protein [Planctomycetaceae bacterium]|jgi:uncharacterized protein (DUF58 family)|nr:DUF58 domain-containing protein [Planctomycetaceae bacterium]
MTLRPGRNLLGLAAASVLLAAVAFYLPAASWLLLPLLFAAGTLAAYDGFWLRRHQSDLAVSRDLPQIAGRDVPFDVTLRCVNRGLGRLRGSVREVAPAEALPRWWTADFPPQGITSSAEYRQSFRIATRGRFDFGPAWVRLVGPCRMLEGLWVAAGQSRIKVFPEGLVAKDDLSQHLSAEIQVLDRRSRAKRRSAGTEFESIHEYRAGDDPRRIDWRATARTRRLVIRRFQVEQHQDVLILIDCGRLMGAAAGRGSKLDCAVDSALLLARVALANGDRCGAALFDNQVTGYLPPRSSMAAFHTVVESLYDAQSRWQETDFAPMFAHLQSRRQKRAVIIVLSDVGDEETSRRARVALSSLAARHVVIFAALQTPLLLAQTHAPIADRLDAARHAVAYRLLRERERTLHALRRGNVQVLDVAPDELTIPLINRYLEFRSRG